MSEKLWPVPLEIIGVTGEYGSGKTVFGLTIDPKRTRVYDEEKSSAPYISLGFDRVDLFAEASRGVRPGQSLTPLVVFEWWRQDIARIKPGQYRVVMLDTIGTLEAGLCDWVEQHPEHFGHTRATYQKMGGVFWGDVKELWKLTLTELASKVETLVFTAHMGSVWQGKEVVVGKRKPKGKDTLMELASLYLRMERKPDARGNLPAKPSATVLKSRLMCHRLDEATGEILITPILPPRLPVATPHAIREYMRKPPDYFNLAEGERAAEERLTDDERLQLRAAAASAERDAEALRLEQAERLANRKPAARKAEATPAEVAHSNEPPPETQVQLPSEESATGEQLARLAELRDLVFTSENLTRETGGPRWLSLLEAYGVTSARNLTAGQAEDLIGRLAGKHDPFS